jgi:hypothetical protein
MGTPEGDAMRGDPLGLRRTIEFDALGLAVGSSLVAGALSLLEGYLAPLVGSLAALALASWAMMRAQDRDAGRSVWTRRRGVGIASLAAGAVFFLAPLPEETSARGLVLALALVPLWWSEGSRVRKGGL